jgi:hypothetical protein
MKKQMKKTRLHSHAAHVFASFRIVFRMAAAAAFLMFGMALGADLVFPPSPGKMNLPLTVTDFSGINRLREVVTGGVPLPRGVARDTAGLRVVDAAGQPVPCQFAVMDRWWAEPDPSVRWVLVDFIGDVFANDTATYYLRDDAGAAPAPATPLRVTDEAEKVTVITGPLKFTVSKKAFNLFDEAWYDQNGDGRFDDAEKYVSSSPENGGVLTSGDWPDQGYKKGGKYYSSAQPPTNFVIEENGPCRVSIRVDGTHHARPGEDGSPDGLYNYRVRVQAFAGQPGVKVSYSIANMRVAADWKIPPIRNFEVGTRVDFRGEHAAQFTLDPDHLACPPLYSEGSSANFAYATRPDLWGRRVDDSRVTLYQDSSGGEQWKDLIPNAYNTRIFGGNTVTGVTFRGYKVFKDGREEIAGWRAAGQMDVRSSGNYVEVPLRYAVDPTQSNQKTSINRGVTLTLRDFRQRYPKALYGEKGRLAVQIFPEESGRDFHIERSSCRTHEMQFFFHGPVLYARHYDWLALIFDNPLLPRAPAEWYARSQAWDMGVARTASIPLTEFNKHSFDGVRLGEEVYGWITPWNPGGQHWNEASQFASWATRGDWGAFQSAEVSTRWGRDLVRTQTECPPEQWDRFALYLMGWNLRESRVTDRTYPGYKDTTAWIGIPDSGHAGQLMLLEHYRLTGDRFSRDAVERLGLRGRAYAWKGLKGRDAEKDATLMSDNRYAAWPLFNSMQGASLTGDRKQFDEARQVALTYRNAVRYSPIGWMCLTINDKGSPEVYGKVYPVDKRGPGASAVYAGFQFGLVVIALAKYYEETGDEEARDTILATCDVLVNRSMLRTAAGKPVGWSYCWGDVWGASSAGNGNWNDDAITAIGYGYRLSGRQDFLEALQAGYEAMKTEYRPFSQVGYACVVHPRIDQVPPAAVTGLAAEATGNNQVRLTWQAPGDDGQKGRAALYQVKYARMKMVERVTDWPPPGVEMPSDKAGYRKLADAHRATVCSFYQAMNVAGEPKPQAAGKNEQFTLKDLAPGQYWIALKSFDAAQNSSEISNVVTVDVPGVVH